MSGKKIAIVTGASSGMGREMVYLLADHFAALEEIWVIARRKDRLEELVGKVPVSLRILPFDLSGEEDLRRLSAAFMPQPIRGLRRVKVLCAELQPGSGCRVKKEGDLCDSGFVRDRSRRSFSGSLSMGKLAPIKKLTMADPKEQ